MALANTIRQRFPAWREIVVVFLAITFPVNFWALIFFFRELPSYLLRMKVWDIIGVLGYTLVIALLDSLFLLAIIIVLSVCLPRQFFHAHFKSAGFIFMIIAVIAAVSLHYWSFLIKRFTILENPWAMWVWMGALLLLLVFAIYRLMRSTSFESAIHNFLDKLMVLSSVFMFFVILAVVITILRNLGLQ